MGIVELLFYFLWLGLSAGTVEISFRLFKRYRHKFLHYFFYYIIFYYIYGFLNFTGRLMVSGVFKGDPQTMHGASQVVAVMASPVLFVGLYFALRWIRQLLNRRVPRWLKIVYWIIQATVLAAFFYGVSLLIEEKSFDLAGPILEALTTFELFFIFGILSQLYLLSGAISDAGRKRLVHMLSHLYFAGFGIMVIVGKFIRLPFYIYPDRLSLQILVTSMFFFLNIPPLFYLMVFLRKGHGEWGILPPSPDRVAFFCKKYHITGREWEIVERIVKGKTNNEISDELFISIKTVKNNVSNIYKKTGVKNRVQLNNLLRGL
jgi:DNA-binding CsgD family transcriptional regulator